MTNPTATTTANPAGYVPTGWCFLVQSGGPSGGTVHLVDTTAPRDRNKSVASSRYRTAVAGMTAEDRVEAVASAKRRVLADYSGGVHGPCDANHVMRPAGTTIHPDWPVNDMTISISPVGGWAGEAHSMLASANRDGVTEVRDIAAYLGSAFGGRMIDRAACGELAASIARLAPVG